MYLDVEANSDGALIHPFFMAGATQPAAGAGGAAPKKLKVIITGVEGRVTECARARTTLGSKPASA